MINDDIRKTIKHSMPNLSRVSYQDYLDIPKLGNILSMIERSKINVLSCRCWIGTNPWIIPRRILHDNFFIYSIKGHLKVILDEQQKVLEPGEFMLIPDRVYHSYMIPENRKFSEHIITHSFTHAPDGRNLIGYFKDSIFKVDSPEYWNNRFEELSCLSEWQGDLFKARSESLMKTLLQEIVMNGARLNCDNFSGDPRIGKALDIIEREYPGDLSIEELAGICDLKPVRFRELFKKQTGMSPRKYLIDYRIKKAKVLLVSTTKSVREISKLTGFQHEYYFCSVFKKENGQTPTQYRTKLFPLPDEN